MDLVTVAPSDLLDVLPDAIVVVDQNGHILHSNVSANLLFGYDPGELHGMFLETLIPEPFRAHHVLSRRKYNPLSFSGQPHTANLNLSARRKNGSTFAVEITLAPLGEKPIILVVVRDVTSRVQIESELAEANKALNAFNYSIAHDLLTPIRIMASYANLIQRDYGYQLDELCEGYLQHIVNEAKEATRLTEGLLTLSKIGQEKVAPEELDLSSLARTIVRNLSVLEPERNVEVYIEDNLYADIDPRMARSLLQNLLSNAWKFSSKAKHPKVVFGKKGDEFYVKDNGIGFNPAKVKRLFVPFERLHGTAFAGHGVGLAICHRIVQQHGGQIRAENIPPEQGGGAVFYFTLPHPTGDL